MGDPDEEKAENIFGYFKGEAFDFYFEQFTDENTPTEEYQAFQLVKEKILKKYTTKKTDAEILREAAALKYKGWDTKVFIMKADKLCIQTKLDDQAKFGLVRQVIKSKKMLLQFVLFRGDKSYEEVKKTYF